MIKYILYARKSSESDDKQIQSIESQTSHMGELAKARGLNVVKVITEAASSKTPGKRKGFNEMIKLIERGFAQGIITWNADRLSRNAIDSGKLIYLFDLGKLVEIVTQSHVYVNDPTDKFMLGIDFGRAKADNDNKGIAVKRGMGDKAKTGWYPGPAPIGYINTPELTIGKRFIKIDELRFPYLKKAWSEVLRNKPIFVVWEQLNQEWLKDGHNELFVARSPFYAMFSKPFYYGEYEYPADSGKWFIGKHEPMVTREEFDMAQRLRGLSKPCRRTHTVALKGIFHCSECGCLITATVKFKFNHKLGQMKPYIYYHCTKKKPNIPCHQPRVKEKDLFKQIKNLLLSFKVPPEFSTRAKKWNEYLDTQELQKTVKTKSKTQELITKEEAKLKDLRQFLLKGTFTESEYFDEKATIERAINTLKQGVSNKKEMDSTEFVKKSDFAVHAWERFRKGNEATRYDVVTNLGSNFLLKEGKVSIQLDKTYIIFQKFRKGRYNQKGRFELSKYADVFKKRPDLLPLNPSWLPD
jgi:site-specific DNA recombinase